MRRHEYHIRPDERFMAALAYLGGVIPIWGIVMAWVIREVWRERSRHVVFHTVQVIWWQTALLLAFVIYVLTQQAVRVTVAAEGGAPAGFRNLVGAMESINEWVILVVSALYIVLCLIFVWRTLDGHDVKIPIIGPRIHRQVFGTDKKTTNSQNKV